MKNKYRYGPCFKHIFLKDFFKEELQKSLRFFVGATSTGTPYKTGRTRSTFGRDPVGPDPLGSDPDLSGWIWTFRVGSGPSLIGSGPFWSDPDLPIGSGPFWSDPNLSGRFQTFVVGSALYSSDPDFSIRIRIRLYAYRIDEM